MTTLTLNQELFLPTAPAVVGNGIFIHPATSFAASYTGATLAPGAVYGLNEAFGVTGTVLMPALADVGVIRTFNIFVALTSDGTAADTWELHVWPARTFINPFFPTITPNVRAAGFGEYVTRTKLYTGTHQATATQAEHQITVGAGIDEFIVGGGGSGVLVSTIGQMLRCAPYIGIELKNTGATDTFTLDTLAVWGSYED